MLDGAEVSGRDVLHGADRRRVGRDHVQHQRARRCPSTRTAPSRCASPVRTRRSRTAAVRLDLPSRRRSCSRACRSATTSTRRSRLQHGSALRSTGTPADRAGGRRSRRSRTRRPPGAAMFAQPRLDQALAAPDRSGHAEAFGPRPGRIARSSPPTPRTPSAIDELVRTRVFPGFMHAISPWTTVGNGWRSTGQPHWVRRPTTRFRPIANFGGIWWNSASEVIYYALQADETGEIRRPATTPTRSASAPGESAGRARRRLLVDHAVLAPGRAARAEPDRQVLDQLPHDARTPMPTAASPSTSPRAARRSAAVQLAAEHRPGEPWVLVLRLYLPRPTSWTAAGPRRR